jgi:UrcA family protein
MNDATSISKTGRRAAVLALALFAGAGMIATASAATPDADVPSAHVRYGDLNLSTEQGAKALYRRIASAARQVCPDGESRGLENLNRARSCQRAAIERAVQSVHNEHLAAIYAAAFRHG